MTRERVSNRSPVVATLAAGFVAVAIGLIVMRLGGALSAYLAVNAAAAVVGLVVAGGLSFVPPSAHWPVVAAALALLATAIWGNDIDGIRRWIVVGPVRLQPTFLLVPLLVCTYARFPASRLVAGTWSVRHWRSRSSRTGRWPLYCSSRVARSGSPSAAG